MKILLIINDPPSGTERCFNALRLAPAVLKEEQKPELSVFLMADAVLAAKAGQSTPDGNYSLENTLICVILDAAVLICGTCMDARGIGEREKEQEIIAYCRGEYFVLAFEAVAALRKNGFSARRLEEGYPEWKAAGLPVERI